MPIVDSMGRFQGYSRILGFRGSGLIGSELCDCVIDSRASGSPCLNSLSVPRVGFESRLREIHLRRQAQFRDGHSESRMLGDFPLDDLLKLRWIDIATRDDANGSTCPRFPGQSGGNGNATSALHDNPMPLE